MSNLVPFETMQSMAVSIAKSGLFGIRNVDQAVALMLIAQAEGLHPAVAARDYHVINNRPALKADAMLARFQQAGGSVRWGTYTDQQVTGTFSHPQGGSVEISWTLAMANNAGLTKNPTWRQYPRQMLRARVISEGVRTVYPAVSVGVYTPEEVQDFDQRPPRDAGPKVIDAEVVEEGPSDELVEVLDYIALAETESDLAELKPRIKALNGHERSIAIQAGIARKAQLAPEPVEDEPDSVEVVEGEVAP